MSAQQQETVSFKALLLDEQYKEEAKDAWKKHNDETNNLDVLERCRRFNELLSKEFLVSGKTSDILGSLRSGPAKPSAAPASRPQQPARPASGARTSAAGQLQAASRAPPPLKFQQVPKAQVGAGTAGRPAAHAKPPPKPAQRVPTGRAEPRHSSKGASQPTSRPFHALPRHHATQHTAQQSAEDPEDDDIFGVLNLLNSSNDCADDASSTADYRQQLVQDRAAVVMQKFARRWLARRRAAAMRVERRAVEAATLLQAAVRGWAAREQAGRLQMERAACTVQRCWRGVLARRAQRQLAVQHQQLEAAAVVVQCCWRQVLAQRAASAQKLEHQRCSRAAVVLQHAWRCCLARRQLQHKRRVLAAAITLQTAFRGISARRHLAGMLEDSQLRAAAEAAQVLELQAAEALAAAADGSYAPEECCSSTPEAERSSSSYETLPRSPTAACDDIPITPNLHHTAETRTIDAPHSAHTHRPPRPPDPEHPPSPAAQYETSTQPTSASTSLNPLRRATSASTRQPGAADVAPASTLRRLSREPQSSTTAGHRRLSHEHTSYRSEPRDSLHDNSSNYDTVGSSSSSSRVVAESRQRLQEVGDGERVARSELEKRAIMVRSEHRSTQQAMEVVKRPGGKGPDMQRP